MKYLIIYLIIINTITFLLYALDKFKAIIHSYRIPEKVLFILALLGGGFGSIIGMVLVRHKTKKIYFYIWNILCVAGWVFIIIKMR